MTTTVDTMVDTGRKRAFCTLKTHKEEATMEWIIDDFVAWAESKDVGSCHNSSTFRFHFTSIKKIYNFSINIYPRGNAKDDELEDQIGIFLTNNNKEEIHLKMCFQILNKNGQACKKWDTDRKMKGGSDWGWKNIVSRKKLIEDKAEVMPDGALTIRCDIVVIVSDIASIAYDLPQPAKRRAKSLESDLDKMLASATFSDFKIVCQTHTLDVHKTILAARSDVFAAMLSADNKETKSSKLIIEDFDIDVVRQMVTFIYTGKLKDSENLVCPELLLLADKYNLSDLVYHCGITLAENLKLENAVAVLNVAVKTSSKYLLKRAASFVARNFPKIKATPEWKKLKNENPSAIVPVLEEIA
jgi:hypothetical protein